MKKKKRWGKKDEHIYIGMCEQDTWISNWSLSKGVFFNDMSFIVCE